MDVQKSEREVLGDGFTCRDMRPRTGGPQVIEFKGELDGERVKICVDEKRRLSAMYGRDGAFYGHGHVSSWEFTLFDSGDWCDDDGRPLNRVFDEDYNKGLRRVVDEWRARHQRT